MSAGTLTLTNNSDIVTGIGTSFVTELAAGDFVVVTVGGVPYTLPVKSVESDTDMTLVSVYTGPTQSGAAWSAVPRIALNMVTAALVSQSAEALRGLNYDKQNWQQVYSASGSITVKLPDGSTFTGPSWKYLADNMATKTDGAVPISQGGTGSKTAAGARTNLGLGEPEDYCTRGNSGWNVYDPPESAPRATNEGNLPTGLYWGTLDMIGNPLPGIAGCSLLQLNGNSTGYRCQLAFQDADGGRVFLRSTTSGTQGNWKELVTSPVSDGRLKTKTSRLDTEFALNNIKQLQFWNFIFNKDAEKAGPVRRGIISQQIKNIDPQYVKEVGGYLHLDNTPLLLDGLAAIQELIKRDEDKALEISEIKKQLAALTL